MTDPAGLDAATEAARAAYDSVVIAHGAFGHRSGHYEGTVAAVRAAAPHLIRGERRAALLEAADDFDGEPWVKAWLRERAERETT